MSGILQGISRREYFLYFDSLKLITWWYSWPVIGYSVRGAIWPLCSPLPRWKRMDRNWRCGGGKGGRGKWARLSSPNKQTNMHTRTRTRDEDRQADADYICVCTYCRSKGDILRQEPIHPYSTKADPVDQSRNPRQQDISRCSLGASRASNQTPRAPAGTKSLPTNKVILLRTPRLQGTGKWQVILHLHTPASVSSVVAADAVVVVVYPRGYDNIIISATQLQWFEMINVAVLEECHEFK